jgi:hypothetical protein
MTDGGRSAAAEAVFVVGVSRSGTTLMRHILERSSQVSVCRESHYLGHLLAAEGVRQQVRRRFGGRRDDETARRVVAFLYGDGLERASRLRRASRQWTWTRRHVPREQFEARYLASDRSERALFDIVLRTYAEHEGKPIVGEKTPAHVRYVDTLLEWYPDGRIVHMVRDPRAIYVSEMRRRRSETPSALPYRLLRGIPVALEVFVLVETTMAWLESVSLLERNLARYPGHYLAMPFETLVADPEACVRRLCAFLGIPFEPAMLEQVVVSRGHALGSTGFDRAAATRWRNRIGPLVDRWFRAWFGRRMRRLGYDG